MPPINADSGHHDLRRGATAYSAIIGAFGALAVPAIVFLFAAPKTLALDAHTLETFATALLVTGMSGCLLAAIAFAFLGAERDEVAALAPAIIFVAVPVSVSVVSILASFEVLAAIYQPQSKALMAFVVIAAGFFGVVYASIGVTHSIHLGPSDPAIRQTWLDEQPIGDRSEARRVAIQLGTMSVIPILFAGILRVANVHSYTTPTEVDLVVSVAFVLILVSTLAAVLRMTPVLEPSRQKGLRLREAYMANGAIALYVFILLIVLP
jgi:hypothetical protein